MNSLSDIECNVSDELREWIDDEHQNADGNDIKEMADGTIDKHLGDHNTLQVTSISNNPQKPNFYLTKQRFEDEFGNLPLILTDMQFIDGKMSEIAIIRPDSPAIYHRFYNVPTINNRVATEPMNRRTVEHNISYTGHVPGIAAYNIFNDRWFFATLPTEAVYVIRGQSKYRLLKSMLNEYKKRYRIFTFPEKFDRAFQCPLHVYHNSMCAAYNVIHMSHYYKKYTQLSNIVLYQ